MSASLDLKWNILDWLTYQFTGGYSNNNSTNEAWGLSKTYFFQIPEDFLLASATIPGLYLFFREYFLNNLHADTKPKAKYRCEKCEGHYCKNDISTPFYIRRKISRCV